MLAARWRAINVVSGPGMLDYLLTQSLEKLLLDHEACGMALRLVRGIERHHDDTVALIGELVATGSLLGHPHTRQLAHGADHPVAARRSRHLRRLGEDGRALTAERAAAEVPRLLAAPPADPLPEEVAAELARIVSAEGRRWGADSLPEILPMAATR